MVAASANWGDVSTLKGLYFSLSRLTQCNLSAYIFARAPSSQHMVKRRATCTSGFTLCRSCQFQREIVWMRHACPRKTSPFHEINNLMRCWYTLFKSNCIIQCTRFSLFISADEPSVAAGTDPGLGSGAIAGIVIAVILIVLITIDLFCCFFNSCGVIFCCHKALCAGGGGGGGAGDKSDCKLFHS